jgi:hypothetical protein
MISTVMLYRFTYDRWNWGGLVRRTLKTMGAVIAFVVLAWGVIYAINEYTPGPSRQTDFAGLSLGMTMQEVQYIKGRPTAVYEPAPGGSKFKLLKNANKLDEGITPRDYLDWGYDADKDHRVSVEFDEETKQVSSIMCYSSSSLECPKLLDIYDGTSERDLVRRLGTPSASSFESTAKRIEYKQYNLIFYLAKEQVYMYGIKAPK